MEGLTPRVMENREFVALEEEDIQKLNRSEAEKFEANPEFDRVIAQIESELGGKGKWEEHWLTVDANGRRVYARIYYAADRGVAVSADGRIIRELNYPHQDAKHLH